MEDPSLRVFSSPVPVDDDRGRAGRVEAGGLLCVTERLLVEHVGAVHVSPGQQQVLDPQLDPLLPVLQPGGVVQVSALVISLPFLYTWTIGGK